MNRIRAVLLEFRPRHADLQQLALACGASASWLPPSAELIDKVRNKVAKKLKLSPAEGGSDHPASPWKFALVRQVLLQARDPDLEIARWLEEGTPVGIAEPIFPSGLLPRCSRKQACLLMIFRRESNGLTTIRTSTL